MIICKPKYGILLLTAALCASVSLCAQHYRVDYEGEGTPAVEIRYYAGDILREDYNEHASVSFAECFVLISDEEDDITGITFAYAKGEESVYKPVLIGVDSVNVTGSRELTTWTKNNRNKSHPGHFLYPYVKTGLEVGIYRDTLVIQGQLRGATLTISLFLEQRVARFHEVYIDKGETYTFQGEQLSVSGRYIRETDVLDLVVVEPCEVHIEASETFLHEPGTVQLNADRAGDYYEWTGYGLDDPAIRNPKATIDTDGEKEYTMELTAFTETGPNLAPNGNFEGGYTGFETDYSAISNPLFFIYFKGYENIYIKGAGHYSLVVYPNQVNGPWPLCKYDGYMMVIDGHYIANNRVYASYVNVEPHTWYAFSVDVASVSNIVTNQPKLQFYINDQTLGDSHVPNTTACDWKKLYTIWYSGETAGSIPIILRNTQTASGGNDFAIDNLSFRKLCRATDRHTIKADFSAAPECEVNIEASETELCHTDEVQLTTDREADYYLWRGYGLNDTTIRNPVAALDQRGDYTYEVTVKSYTEYGDNLITNGDFEMGDAGFISDYKYSPYNEENMGHGISPGRYSIVDYPMQVNWPWAACTYDGKMMVVDGKNDNKNNDVFRTEVDVKPDTWYAFSCEVATVSDSYSLWDVASLQFYINGIVFSEIHHPDTAHVTGYGAGYRVCRWKKIYQLWYSDDNSHIVISLQDHNGVSSGNDFAVDNLRFMPVCEASDTIHIHVNTNAQDTVYRTFTACGSYMWHDKEYKESGTYLWTGKTTAGCDSVEQLSLTIARPKTVELADTACVSYTWHGRTYTESGEYTWETQTVLGCDSVETLTLTIQPSYLIPDTVTACDTYMWQGDTYTRSGDYRKDYRTVHGCDSVLTLNLTVNYRGEEEEQMIEYKEYAWKGQNYTASGDYQFDTLTTHGCDSLITLHLTIVDTPFVASLLPVADLCADDYNVALEYTLSNVLLSPQSLDVTFSNSRFSDIRSEDVSGTILVPVPDSIRPDYYSGLLAIRYKSYVQEMPFSFLVRYPSTVIGQKWNNVLALKNSRYNGGYLWDAYRWYVDNTELAGETQSFIYCGVGKTLLMGHPYHASLRRVGEDYFIPTCPIIPVPHEDAQPIPTFFQPGQHVAIRRDGQDVTVTFYDMVGRVIVSGTEVDAPSVPGVYMLEADGQIQKTIVR
ncbi:MAG: hypothetical protein J6Y00_03985 [Paludibacteraceae bacterium]|nr:hypothetical protein [Paludibacteraceae bacterium]